VEPAVRIALPVLALILATGAQASPGRDSTARAKFQRENPCPATGKTRGSCPGWQVDHITPLKCGGADRSENMQWLTVQAHAEKTRAEAKDCRRH